MSFCSLNDSFIVGANRHHSKTVYLVVRVSGAISPEVLLCGCCLEKNNFKLNGFSVDAQYPNLYFRIGSLRVRARMEIFSPSSSTELLKMMLGDS